MLEQLLEQNSNVVRRAKAPHPSGRWARLATVVPAVMLSSELCRVGRESPCRATHFAHFTQHKSIPDLAAGLTSSEDPDSPAPRYGSRYCRAARDR